MRDQLNVVRKSNLMHHDIKNLPQQIFCERDPVKRQALLCTYLNHIIWNNIADNTIYQYTSDNSIQTDDLYIKLLSNV